MTSLGSVEIECPICHRRPSIPFHVRPCDADCDHEPAKPGTFCIGHIQIDQDAVYAHLLTHGPHDGGEPLPAAA